MAAGEEIAAIAAVVVVGEGWADAVEDGAAAVRPHRKRHERGAFMPFFFTRTIHQNDTRFATTDFLHGSVWGTFFRSCQVCCVEAKAMVR